MAKTVSITKTIEFGSSILNTDTISLTVTSGTVTPNSITVQEIEDGGVNVEISDNSLTQITATLSSGTCSGESTTITITDNTITPTPSATPSASVTPTVSDTPSVTVTPSESGAAAPSPTPSISITATVSSTPSVSNTPGVSDTPSASVTPTVSDTPSVTVSPSKTPSVSVTPTISDTPSVSVTPTISDTPSVSVSKTPSISVTRTPSISVTPSPSPETGICRYVHVASTGVDINRYGLRYSPPGGSVTDVLFSSLFGVPHTEGGVEGLVYSVCSTLSPSIWDSNTNTTIGSLSGVTFLADGGACSQNGDCIFTTSPTPSRTPSVTRTPSISVTPSNSSIGYNSWSLGSGPDAATACGENLIPTYFTAVGDTSLQVGVVVYVESSLNSPYTGQYLADGTNWYYTPNGDGEITQVGSCATPTPTPTVTPSPVYSSWLGEDTVTGNPAYLGPYSQTYQTNDEVLASDGNCYLLGAPSTVSPSLTISALCITPTPSATPPVSPSGCYSTSGVITSLVSAVDTCSGTTRTVYHNGPSGLGSATIIYTISDCNTVQSNNVYYNDSGTYYYWDGSTLTAVPAPDCP